MSAPNQNIRPYSGTDARRSVRIERAIPLVIIGTDKLGRSIQEETSAVSLNLHGCRCSSRNEYPILSPVTLQLARSLGGAHAQVVRARVRTILPPKAPGEFCQVGVEFETPANVWGIDAPPDNWQRLLGRVLANTTRATAVAPAREPAMFDQAREIVPGKPEPSGGKGERTTECPAWIAKPQGRELDYYHSRAEEIAQQLELLIHSARTNLSQLYKFVEHVTHQLEPQLHARLNESFGHAAKELQQAGAQISERQFANFTLGAEALWQEMLLQWDARVAEARSLFEHALKGVTSPGHMETLLHSAKEEMLGCVEARLQEMSSHWEKQQERQRSRLEEVAQKLERPTASPAPDLGDARKLAEQVVHDLEPQVSAMVEKSVGRATKDFENAAAQASDRQHVRLKDERQQFAHETSRELEAGVIEARTLLQKSANLILEEFRRQLGVQMDLAMSDATQRMTSSLSSLDAENRAACDAHRREMQNEVSRAAEQSSQELRSGMKAFLYSCLVAAVRAVDEHSQATLKGLDKNAVNQPHDLAPFSGASGNGKNSSSGDDNSH